VDRNRKNIKAGLRIIFLSQKYKIQSKFVETERVFI